MPELILFGACKVAVIDNEDHSISLISLLSSFEVRPELAVISGAGDQNLQPQDLLVPMDWSAVSLWQVLPQDTGVSFEQKVDIYFPDGTPATNMESQGTYPFELGSTNTHTLKILVHGFPVSMQGTYAVKLFLRQKGTETWEEKASYPVVIIHKQ